VEFPLAGRWPRGEFPAPGVGISNVVGCGRVGMSLFELARKGRERTGKVVSVREERKAEEDSSANGVSLNLGPGIRYNVIQRLDECAQLAGWLSHYFPM
jgi:hypothetical protein